jgi:hypothetical protein
MLSACVEHKQNRKYGITTTKVNGKTASNKASQEGLLQSKRTHIDDILGLIVMHE